MRLLDLCHVSTEGSKTILNCQGYGRFTVSRMAEVCRINKDGTIKPPLTYNFLAAMPSVTLGCGLKYPLELIVALCHVPNPMGYPLIGHKDKDPFNCEADNLYWTSCNMTQRTSRHFRNKFYHKAFVVTKGDTIVDTYESCVAALMSVGLTQSYARTKILSMLNGYEIIHTVKPGDSCNGGYSESDTGLYSIRMCQYASTEASVKYVNGKLAVNCTGCGETHLLRDYKLINRKRSKTVYNICTQCNDCVNAAARARAKARGGR